MDKLKDFIMATALADGRQMVLRSENISAVYDNDAVCGSYGVKPACRTIVCAGESYDVVESMEDICSQIMAAEM